MGKVKESGQGERLILLFAKAAIVELLITAMVIVAAYLIFDTCPWLLTCRVGASRSDFNFGIGVTVRLKGIYGNCHKPS